MAYNPFEDDLQEDVQKEVDRLTKEAQENAEPEVSKLAEQGKEGHTADTAKLYEILKSHQATVEELEKKLTCKDAELTDNALAITISKNIISAYQYMTTNMLSDTYNKAGNVLGALEEASAYGYNLASNKATDACNFVKEWGDCVYDYTPKTFDVLKVVLPISLVSIGIYRYYIRPAHQLVDDNKSALVPHNTEYAITDDEAFSKIMKNLAFKLALTAKDEVLRDEVLRAGVPTILDIITEFLGYDEAQAGGDPHMNPQGFEQPQQFGADIQNTEEFKDAGYGSDSVPYKDLSSASAGAATSGDFNIDHQENSIII